MKRICICLIILISVLIIGCSEKADKISVAIKELDECMYNLSVLENKFGINIDEIYSEKSECKTRSPWYRPEVAKFKLKMKDQNGREYLLFYSDNCPRHESGVVKICVNADKGGILFPKIKEHICNGLGMPGIYQKDYIAECKAGLYESIENGKITISLSKHIAGASYARSSPEDNFTGVKQLDINNCEYIN